MLRGIALAIVGLVVASAAYGTEAVEAPMLAATRADTLATTLAGYGVKIFRIQ